MANETYVTIKGWVAGPPTVWNNGGDDVTTVVRVGVTSRRWSRDAGHYVDGPTVWYAVRCYGELGLNVANSVYTGTPLLARGRQTIRTWQTNGGEERLELVIVADAVGVELSKGRATYVKVRHGAAPPIDEPSNTDPGAKGTGGQGVGRQGAGVQETGGQGSDATAGDAVGSGSSSPSAGTLGSAMTLELDGVVAAGEFAPECDEWVAGEFDDHESGGEDPLGSADASGADPAGLLTQVARGGD